MILKKQQQTILKNNLVVFVVVGQTKEKINDRVAKILTLAPKFKKMVLVSTGDKNTFIDNIIIRPWINPTGLLRLFKLNILKKKIDRYLFFPSAKILWVRAAYPILKKQIVNEINKGHQICLIICAPPHDLCILGLWLKSCLKNNKLKWIIDWQDLWSYDENYYNRIPKIYHNRLYKIENKFFNSCDVNITTNKKAKKVVETRYNIPPYKVIAINHHFNKKDFLELNQYEKFYAKNRRNGTIKLGYLGTLFKPPRVPGEKVIKTLDNLVNRGINVELHLCGLINRNDMKKIKGLRNKIVKLYGVLKHEESLAIMSACDMLLLVLDDLQNCRVVMSIKLPHYLSLNIPIIAIVPKNSAIEEIINTTRTGYVIHPDSNWETQLIKIFNRHSKNAVRLERNEEAIQEFSWEKISAQWENVIN